MQSITFDQIQLFMSLFKGRNDIYARRWEKDGRSGYSPAYQLNWQEFAVFKAKGGKFSDFPNKKPLLLTAEVVRDHLNGTQTIGMYPLLTDNTAFLDFKTLTVVENQWEFLKQVKKVNSKKFDSLYQKLVVGDAPSESKPAVKNDENLLTIIMGSTIKLPKTTLKPQLIKFLRDKLNFFNTEYLVKEKMGISTYQTEKYFKLISEAGEYVLLPRGFLNELITFCKEANRYVQLKIRH